MVQLLTVFKGLGMGLDQVLHGEPKKTASTPEPDAPEKKTRES
jgi:hypothetical protein